MSSVRRFVVAHTLCPLQVALESLLARWDSRHLIQELNIGLRDIEPTKESLLVDRLENALALLERYDPQRLRRIQRGLRRIVVTEKLGRNAASYVPATRSCYLDAAFVETYSAANIAIALVHEGTHARLHDAGIRASAALLTRIERLCVAAELEFAKKLPVSVYRSIPEWMRRRTEYLDTLLTERRV